MFNDPDSKPLQKEVKCPECGYKMGRVGLPEKGRVVPKPKKDDICLCFNCAAMLRFNADEETVHTVTKEELASLDSDTLYYVLHEQATLKAFAMKRKIDLAAKQKAELN